MFCQVDIEQVIAVHDVSSTYHVPLLLETQGLIAQLERILRLDNMQIPAKLKERGATIWRQWQTLTCSKDNNYDQVTIVLVGKYTSLKDSYLSCIKALEHAAMANRRKLELLWIDASHLEAETRERSPAEYHKAWHQLCTAQGIFVPGGFGTRGTEG